MDELHAKGPEASTPAPAPIDEEPRKPTFAERMALAKAAKKARTPAPDEETQLPGETEKMRRKPARKRKKTIYRLSEEEKARKKKHLEPAELQGITPLGCPVACQPECCVITGENVCGHPAKGGLQAKYLQMAPVLSRFNQARQELARVETEKKKAR